MIFTEPKNKILNQIELVRKDYDILKSYKLYHANLFELALDYIPIQYLPTSTFGFSFRVYSGDFYTKDSIFKQKQKVLQKRSYNI